jgi:hypothetical protein
MLNIWFSFRQIALRQIGTREIHVTFRETWNIHMQACQDCLLTRLFRISFND